MAIDPRIREAIERGVKERSAHLIDLIIRGARGNRVVEVYIDTEEGVTTDLCSEVSRHVMSILDSARLIDGAYRMEVSSPGIDRPLVHPWQYRKHVGRTLRLRVATPDGVQERQGILRAVTESAVELESPVSLERTAIGFDALVEVRVQPRW